MNIQFQQRKVLQEKPDVNNLGFGKYFTDHMFVMDYDDGKWHSPRIIPYGDISVSPALMVLHYGQGIFEGLKAFRTTNDEILLFRPEENFKRLNKSSNRLCIPEINEDFALKCLKALLEVDKEWIPKEKDTCLYIRPFIFASETGLGVHPAHSYKFMIILSPVGSYYGTLGTTKILVEDEYVRAAKGGTGNTKAISNYAMSLKAQEKAIAAGCDQVLWLDSDNRKYIEEVGTMNVAFKIDGTIYTPPLTNGTILPGITRDSVLKILEKENIPFEEKAPTIDEVIDAVKSGTLQEAFGIGTAAKISPIGTLVYRGETYIINNDQIGDTSKYLFDKLTKIQTGEIEDEYGFVVKL